MSETTRYHYHQRIMTMADEIAALRTRAETAEASCAVMVGILEQVAALDQSEAYIEDAYERLFPTVMEALANTPASAAALLARVKALEEAIEPFADISVPPGVSDDRPYVIREMQLPSDHYDLIAGDLRRAHSVSRSKT